jgi:hypothetical protein
MGSDPSPPLCPTSSHCQAQRKQASEHLVRGRHSKHRSYGLATLRVHGGTNVWPILHCITIINAVQPLVGKAKIGAIIPMYNDRTTLTGEKMVTQPVRMGNPRCVEVPGHVGRAVFPDTLLKQNARY